MGMSENKPLPGWPNVTDYAYGYINGEIDWRTRPPNRTDYERALKEAYAARLRTLRRAAIRFMASDIAKKHSHYGCVDAIAEALKAVGELPDEGAG